MEKEEKWQEEIEELLAGNRTVDEWLIHEYACEQSSPNIDLDRLMRACELLGRLILMSPHSPLRLFPGSERERWAGIAGLLGEAGCPNEVIDEFFRRVSRLDLPGPPDETGGLEDG